MAAQCIGHILELRIDLDKHQEFDHRASSIPEVMFLRVLFPRCGMSPLLHSPALVVLHLEYAIRCLFSIKDPAGLACKYIAPSSYHYVDMSFRIGVGVPCKAALQSFSCHRCASYRGANASRPDVSLSNLHYAYVDWCYEYARGD
ncbi:hypothetical protein Tco_0067494 [Tanacetum coccineum]